MTSTVPVAAVLGIRRDPALPRLGWWASIGAGGQRVEAHCGSDVEVGDDFLVEGCWDGDFEAHDFHRANHFFGSGLRVAPDGIYVVPSRATTDRVLVARDNERFVVSNSLVLLLAALGTRLSERVDHRPMCHAILAGVDCYEPGLAVADDDLRVEQHYYRALRLGGTGDFERVIDGPPAQFPDYAAVEAMLLGVSRALHRNMGSRARRNPLRSVSSVSSGYDSPAVTAIVRESGLDAVFTTGGMRTLDGNLIEDGRPIANALGVDATVLEPRRPPAELERLCLAATFDGREIVFADLLEDAAAQRAPTVLWSGYFCSTAWGLDLDAGGRNREVVRTDTSGLNLTEARLYAGCVNVALPFAHVRSRPEMVAVGRSSEMAPWRLGVAYDRPIPRRILESRGVPREVFGQHKARVMEYYAMPRHPALAAELREWLGHNGVGALRRGAHLLAEHADYRLRRADGTARTSLRERLQPGAANLTNLQFVFAINSAADRAQELRLNRDP